MGEGKIMKMIIEPYDALPCCTKVFIINNIECDKDWFGSQESDDCPDDCEGYDCHDSHFEPYTLKKIKNNIKNKIELNDEEIEEVVNKLVEIFRVGDCGWCV